MVTKNGLHNRILEVQHEKCQIQEFDVKIFASSRKLGTMKGWVLVLDAPESKGQVLEDCLFDTGFLLGDLDTEAER